RMHQQASDAAVKEMARRHLLQLDSLDQQDTLNGFLSLLQNRTGHCPLSWKELQPALSTMGWPTDARSAPLDPSGMPYLLNTQDCKVALDPKSVVPGH
ncbi:MAG TPA: hypothetical protein VJ180_09615, partial [Pyrinomonadaceae bacterium]|nr:hypothetical protein [Pyrinomonadaceae bacterium]